MNLFCWIEKEKIKPNTVTWNSLVACYAHNGENDKAFGGERSTRLSTASRFGVRLSLVDAYAKSGKIEYSWAIHDTMSSRDIMTCYSMLSGFVLHGHARSAIELFREMRNQGCRPSRGTFVSLLKAYGLAGRWEAGFHEHLIMPAVEHSLTMVELFGRAGRLSEALEFIENMPVEPNTSIWVASFTACRFHKNVSLALTAAENLVNLEPCNGTFHDLLEQASAVCGGSSSKGIQKDKATQRFVSRSWTVIYRKVHEFTNGDSDLHSELHPSLERIIEEDRTEELARDRHGEKLAMAFGRWSGNLDRTKTSSHDDVHFDLVSEKSEE
ncbi:hypothetical protein MLD38_002109 [Melastoma candidum]|uniref:Uncharacterized protein n=1 Tax=Melastoma candidum TaxID=119954 RepID=A0ACB9SGD3_9MYRT|nr:hypothetical protein MLD38_002109 [Melastoma candidum]